jgi:AcrR family transcriptional regulator
VSANLGADGRTQPARTAHSERVLGQVLLPAANIIANKGILGASVEDLVEAVGITKGTLYYHIKTKEGLLYSIHESVTREGYERWETVLDEERDSSPSATLRRMIEVHCAVIDEFRDSVAVMNEEMKYLPAEMQQDIRRRRADYQGLLESVLERGVQTKEFVIASIRSAASMIIGILNSMYRWYSATGKRTVTEIADTATELVLHGLRSGAR